jgi:hypothetical protein
VPVSPFGCIGNNGIGNSGIGNGGIGNGGIGNSGRVECACYVTTSAPWQLLLCGNLCSEATSLSRSAECCGGFLSDRAPFASDASLNQKVE